jgi:hypothetical protein
VCCNPFCKRATLRRHAESSSTALIGITQGGFDFHAFKVTVVDLFSGHLAEVSLEKVMFRCPQWPTGHQ